MARCSGAESLSHSVLLIQWCIGQQRRVPKARLGNVRTAWSKRMIKCAARLKATDAMCVTIESECYLCSPFRDNNSITENPLSAAPDAWQPYSAVRQRHQNEVERLPLASPSRQSVLRYCKASRAEAAWPA
jgi:hypothetical protein